MYSVEAFRCAINGMFSFVFGTDDNSYGILIHREYSFRFRSVLLKVLYTATSLFT